MGVVRVGDVDVAYGLEGTGPPVVLLHGTTSSRLSWQLVTPLLGAVRTVVMPEFPGSGETVDGGGPLEVDDLVGQVIAVADDLGLERFHLGGWSLGGAIAVAVAAAAPERVESLVPVNAWSKTDARMKFTFGLWTQLIDTDPELFARYAFADGLTLAGHEQMGGALEELIPLLGSTLAPGSLRQIELDGRIDLDDRLASITAPTLVVGGIEDRWVPIEHSRALAASIAGAHLIELPCGHLIPTEQAEMLASLIIEHTAAR